MSRRGEDFRSSRPAAPSLHRTDWSLRTAASSEKAAEAQNATLEFILAKHPLHRPVCDKGGECPSRTSPSATGWATPGRRSRSSPSRSRSRSRRSSPSTASAASSVTAAPVLVRRCRGRPAVASNRRAHTEIVTFGTDLFRAPFSGNVIESAPLAPSPDAAPLRGPPRGTSRTCRPSAALLRRLQYQCDLREGKVKRVLSRNHPEVDGGWLCDKGASPIRT